MRDQERIKELEAQLAELREAAELAVDALDHADTLLREWSPRLTPATGIYGGSACYLKIEGSTGLLRAVLATEEGE